jgi:hypothetical protein
MEVREKGGEGKGEGGRMNTAARGFALSLSLSQSVSLIPLSNGRDDGRRLHCKSIMPRIRFLRKKKNNTLSLS